MKLLAASLCLLPLSAIAHGNHHHHYHHHGGEGNLRGRALPANENAPDWVFDMTKDTKFKDKNGNWKEGVRCGAPKKKESKKDSRRIQEIIERGHNNGRRLAAGEIKTAVHVMCIRSNRCAATQTMVDDQMAVLNEGFASTGFSFKLVSTSFVVNRDWASDLTPRQIEESTMKEANAVDPATTFNVYVSDLANGLLGWATFPDMWPEGHFWDGVVVLGDSLPGGSASPYNLGDTLTHEAGHYLGLYHTFQGGCDRGDMVGDTPAEDEPAYGCPIGRDTCTGNPGSDPVQNFMDYSDDSCMDHFTPDQTSRMMAQVSLYKPNLISGPTAPTCDDGIQNQGEEGIDCGGPCASCPTCDDGIQNQGEEGIDCGGPCASCPTVPADPTCDDGIQNQGEEGIDCGGPCNACPTCSDGIQNQGEQDVDCGGPCEPCSTSCSSKGSDCDTNADCCSGKCKRNGMFASNPVCT